MSKLEKLQLESLKWLKMIFKLRSKGAWGHFFFVGKTDGSEGDLAISLASKDPKGMKTATAGRFLRKKYPGTKFSRGKVLVEGSKYVFEIENGQAAPGVMKKCFKTMSERDGMSFLKTRAIVRMMGDTPDAVVEDASDVEELDEDALTAIDAELDGEFGEMTEEEMNDLVGEQPLDIVRVSADDEAAMLLAEDRRYAEMVNERLGEIKPVQRQFDKLKKQLLQMSPTDERFAELTTNYNDQAARLQEARFALAEELYIGEDPLEPPAELTEEMSACLTAAVELESGRRRQRAANKIANELVTEIALSPNHQNIDAVLLGPTVMATLSELSGSSENVQFSGLSELIEQQKEMADLAKEISDLSGRPPNPMTAVMIETKLKELAKLRANAENSEELQALLTDVQTLKDNEKIDNPMLAELSKRRSKKIKKKWGLPKDFSAVSDAEEASSSRGPSLAQVMRGGGELELDSEVSGSDGKTYKVDRAIAGGGHSAFVLVDESTGEKFLWKPAEAEVPRQAEVAASTLSSRLLPGLCPACTEVSVDDKVGIIQPFLEVKESEINPVELNEEQQDQMVAHMMIDWLVCNHDNHTRQFMIDQSDQLIGIDKGQAFKFFDFDGVESREVKRAKADHKEKLKRLGSLNPAVGEALGNVPPQHFDPNFFPKSNQGLPATPQFYKQMQMGTRSPDLESGPIGTLLANVDALDADAIEELFGDYATSAFPDQREAFLAAVLKRAQSLRSELERNPLSASDSIVYFGGQADDLLEDDAFKPGSAKALMDLHPRMTKTIRDLKKLERPELEDDIERLEAQLANLEEYRADVQNCENYLSGDYMRISPLYAAFESLNVDPSLLVQGYDYSPHMPTLLEKWKEHAANRSIAGSESWDESALASAFKFIESINTAWNYFAPPDIPGNTVSRGDQMGHLIANYASLNPEACGWVEGENDVNITLKWPGVMSTTVGDPITHSYISGKSFQWKFTTEVPTSGRVIGDINPAEQEVSFPPGASVNVSKIIYRPTDKSYRAGEFGSNAVIIAIATLN